MNTKTTTIMNREIKFRAWNKDKKCFFKWDLSMGFTGTDKIWGNVQQFTGQKDDQGREIYEGDIVEMKSISTTKKKIRRVIDDITSVSRTLFDCVYSNGHEIVGSIDKNPELLTK